jgi:hypothetical protein
MVRLFTSSLWMGRRWFSSWMTRNTLTRSAPVSARICIMQCSTSATYLPSPLWCCKVLDHTSLSACAAALRSSLAMSSVGFTLSLRELYVGFLQLRTLLHPVVGAVHGKMVGGGVAGSLHADYLVAERTSNFEHGNLVRGVCVLGMLSQTFTISLGPHAQHAYLQNAQLTAATASAVGLVQQLCVLATMLLPTHATSVPVHATSTPAPLSILPATADSCCTTAV